jgi:hypothetical protein
MRSETKRGEETMPKYTITMSTSYGHYLEVEADSAEEAENKVMEMGQDEIKEKSYKTWCLDGFPMFIEIEKEGESDEEIRI